MDWEDDDVWEYIRKYKVKYCSLYDEGFKRLGCIMCPMQGTQGMLRDAQRWPRYYQAYMRAFEKMVQAKKEREVEYSSTWNSAEDVMRWWIYSPPRGNPDQGVIFE